MSTLCSNHATVRLQIIAHKVREKENTMKLNLPNQLTLLRCVLVPIFLAVLILPENKMAVLVNENFFAMFAEELAQHPEIQTVFLATDYDINYRSMVKNLNVQNTYQLYRDYLDHFRLNRGRS